jgi:hypothetical protein
LLGSCARSFFVQNVHQKCVCSTLSATRAVVGSLHETCLVFPCDDVYLVGWEDEGTTCPSSRATSPLTATLLLYSKLIRWTLPAARAIETKVGVMHRRCESACP